MNKRCDGRRPMDLRPIRFKTRYVPHAEGSCLFEMGKTRVLCVASVEDRIPPFLQGTGKGWITADYAMLPRAGHERTPRNRSASGGRSQEIKRIIGRALRAIVDLELLGERTITLDCDVFMADGGTRTASVNGSYIALLYAINLMKKKGMIDHSPLKDSIGAVSVGLLGDTPLLDICYDEDKQVRMDLNVIMTGSGKYVEIQGTSEGDPASKQELIKMLGIAHSGIRRIIKRINVPVR